ncbi:MAG: aminoacyl-tRNA hydrolase [Acidobacteria bacterium]|nr:aminoacyl-tRNA hydrolase [Acidobacteriota bacterium]
MKLVAGLGNPGEKYRGTRHNVGFEVVDLVARRHGLDFEMAPVEAIQARWRREAGPVVVCKGLGYMNESGRPIAALARYYRIDPSEILVVCDDVNLPLGRLRVRTSGSEGGHNGLRSIADALGTTEYPRLRIGVGRGDLRRDLADHVLAKFDLEERPGIEGAIARAADAVETWIDRGAGETMNIFNRAEA